MGMAGLDVSSDIATKQNWDLYRFFLAAARSGSIATASSVLGESPATVGRKLRKLEAELSATLFDRSVSGVKLTPNGASILARAERIEREVLAAGEAVMKDDDLSHGTVTVAAPSGLGQTVLAPRLRDLHNQHPKVRVRLTLSTRRVNLLNREADIAVRIGPPEQERLIARKLGDIWFGLYASRLYLAELPPFESTADLEGHNVIAAIGALQKTQQSLEFAEIAHRCNVALTTDNIFAQLEAVKSGLGLAPFPKYLGRSDDDLIEVLPGLLKSTADLWVLTHPDIRGFARIRLVQDFISNVCREAICACSNADEQSTQAEAYCA
ncbi:LysR family transcriptional regulator [Ruegeria jejuensis]|uniref:LysR family transcriptional regulator n=1 Tax=Ruegeria jejuensis TaxID=3233338 RepID=UPI00355AF555